MFPAAVLNIREKLFFLILYQKLKKKRTKLVDFCQCKYTCDKLKILVNSKKQWGFYSSELDERFLGGKLCSHKKKKPSVPLKLLIPNNLLAYM